MIPPKLKNGDLVRVVTPARTLLLPWINEEVLSTAKARLVEMGLVPDFGKHVNEKDVFDSSSIRSRVEDLHAAFSDRKVRLIITVIGGFNSNQLLRYLDYDLIRKNPKIVCGFSDITALSNAIYAKTGLVTYSGPHYTYFGDRKGADYTINYFKKCVFDSGPFDVYPSPAWSDERWSECQDNRTFWENKGCSVINSGTAEGTCVGGNLCTLTHLHGTEYMPDIRNGILFIEDDHESQPHHFDSALQSLIHQPGFDTVKGIVIGRFQLESHMTGELLTKIIKTKKELDAIPIIANADFGHTTPMFTFPLGGRARIEAGNGAATITILEH